MTWWPTNARDDFAARAVEPDRLARPPAETSLGDVFSTAWEDHRRSQMTISRDVWVRDLWQEQVDEIKRQGGPSFPNPMDIAPDETIQYEARLGARPGDRDRARQAVDQWIDENPDRGFGKLDDAEMQRRIAARAGLARRAATEAREGQDGFLGLATDFAARSAASLTDPPNIIASFFGAPRAAGILRTALTEGTVNMAASLAAQPAVSRFQEYAALPDDDPSAAEAALYGFAGGFVLGGGLKAIGRLAQAARGRPELMADPQVAEAVRLSDDAQAIADTTPPALREQPLGVEQHVEIAGAADRALQQGVHPAEALAIERDAAGMASRGADSFSAGAATSSDALDIPTMRAALPEQLRLAFDDLENQQIGLPDLEPEAPPSRGASGGTPDPAGAARPSDTTVSAAPAAVDVQPGNGAAGQPAVAGLKPEVQDELTPFRTFAAANENARVPVDIVQENGQAQVRSRPLKEVVQEVDQDRAAARELVLCAGGSPSGPVRRPAGRAA